MTADQVIGLRSPVGFLPSPTLLALWRGVAGRQPLQPTVAIADRGGLPSPIFMRAFQAALGSGLQAREPIINADGTPTQVFLAVGNGVGL